MSQTSATQFQAPPVGLARTLVAIGPGIVVTGSVIGAGELINVPVTAATFGFVLFWVVIISCVIKFFLQVELGRYCLVHNRTTIQAFNTCPGPKLRGTSWVGIAYMVGYTLSLVTVGGILAATAGLLHSLFPLGGLSGLLASQVVSKNIWAVITFLTVAVILWRGLYGELEKLVALLVVCFSLSAVVALFLLQGTEFAMSAGDILSGLTLSLGSRQGTAFAVISLMGALGVTANELFMYPYWVLEKGYARHVGRAESEGWLDRARGWIRVLRMDSAAATALATVITAAYFLVAGAVMHARGKVPSGIEVVKEISAIYTETYGPWSYWLFMLGGFCTLFSTLVVVVAATGRMWTDILSSLGVFDWNDDGARKWCNRIFQNLYLLAFLIITLFVSTPPDFLVRLGQYINGLVNTPIIMFGIGWVAFHTDSRLRMSRFTAAMLLVTMAIILFCIAYGLLGEPGH